MGANGIPMPEKQETLQEILEVNPNAKKKVEEVNILSDEPEQEEDNENEEL